MITTTGFQWISAIPQLQPQPFHRVTATLMSCWRRGEKHCGTAVICWKCWESLSLSLGLATGTHWNTLELLGTLDFG